MKIGTNLFGIGKYIADNPAIAAQQIKAAGFSSVEPMLMFFSKLPQQVQAMGKERVRMGLGKQKNSIWMDDEAPERIALFRSRGLEVVSAQVFGFANNMIPVPALAEALVAFGKENGIRWFVVSGKAATREEADALIPGMNTLARALKEQGMALVYHNHDQELAPLDGGAVLDYILEQCPDMGLELDVGWVQYAGEDPVAWMRRWRDRLVLLHLKDIAPDACPENLEDSFLAIGEGCIPLREIMEEAAHCPLAPHGVIFDQDDARTDFFEESRRGIGHVAACREG